MSTTCAPPERLAHPVAEAAALLGLHPRTVYDAIKRGTIPSIRIGKRILVPRSAITDLLSPPSLPVVTP